MTVVQHNSNTLMTNTVVDNCIVCSCFFDIPPLSSRFNQQPMYTNSRHNQMRCFSNKYGTFASIFASDFGSTRRFARRRRARRRVSYPESALFWVLCQSETAPRHGGGGAVSSLVNLIIVLSFDYRPKERTTIQYQQNPLAEPSIASRKEVFFFVAGAVRSDLGAKMMYGGNLVLRTAANLSSTVTSTVTSTVNTVASVAGSSRRKSTDRNHGGMLAHAKEKVALSVKVKCRWPPTPHHHPQQSQLTVVVWCFCASFAVFPQQRCEHDVEPVHQVGLPDEEERTGLVPTALRLHRAAHVSVLFRERNGRFSSWHHRFRAVGQHYA